MIRHAISNLNGWLAILAIVLSSSAGDVLLSRGMKQIGDLGELRRKRGLTFVVSRILRNRYFLIGVACMAVSFYSLLFGLSWNEVSLIGLRLLSWPTLSRRRYSFTRGLTAGAGRLPCLWLRA
jgi:hypothetical protein